jgi:hypothetical protein
VASTRRWLDRGNPRNAGVRHACQRMILLVKHLRVIVSAFLMPIFRFGGVIMPEATFEEKIEKIANALCDDILQNGYDPETVKSIALLVETLCRYRSDGWR